MDMLYTVLAVVMSLLSCYPSMHVLHVIDEEFRRIVSCNFEPRNFLSMLSMSLKFLVICFGGTWIFNSVSTSIQT